MKKFKFIGAALALSLVPATAWAADCCKEGAKCCKEHAECCKDHKPSGGDHGDHGDHGSHETQTESGHQH